MTALPDGDNKLTPRQKAGRYAALASRHRERFYISFNFTNSYDPATGRYTRGTWPILFKTRTDAEAAMTCLPIFANAEATKDRGKIKSASIERTMIPRRTP